jgi:hypothetical protein
MAATLKSKGAAAKPLSGRTVSFSVNNSFACKGKTDAAGKATCGWKVPPLPQGGKTLTAEFAGEPGFGPSKATATLAVFQAATKLTLGDTSSGLAEGGTLYFHAWLTRITDKAGIDGRPLKLTVNGKSGGTAATVKGTATFSYPIPKGFAGDAKAEVTFDGDDYYLPNSTTRTYPVAHWKQAYLKILSKQSGSVGSKLSFSAYLGESPLQISLLGISGKKLAFQFTRGSSSSEPEGGPCGTVHAITGSDGKATAIFKSEKTCSHLTVKLDYTVKDYRADPDLEMVSIGPAPVQISLPAKSGNIGQSVTLQAHVKRATDGAPRPNVPVTFKLGGNALGSPKTNASGDASQTVKLESWMGIGAKTVTATTASEQSYKAGSGNGTLTIGASNK